MIVNLVGFGSIGKRHLKHLLRFKFIKRINIFTRKSIDLLNCDSRLFFFNIDELESQESYLTIVATPANTHIDFIRRCYQTSKKILVEKPLTDYSSDLFVKNLDPEQKIFVGYNLRFLEVIQHLRKIIFDLQISNKPFLLRVINTSHIKTWRDEPITESISLDPDKGGGALLELSHDIDLVDYLLKIDNKNTLIKKIKKPLNINKIESSYNCVGISKIKTLLQFFFPTSRQYKTIYSDSKDISYKADLIKYLTKYQLGSVVNIRSLMTLEMKLFKTN